MSKKKLVFITNIPNQYRIPLFNELHKQLQDLGGELHVIFGAKGYEKRKTVVDLSHCQFNYTILESSLFRKIENKTGFLFYSGLLGVLQREKADEVIVTGYAMSTIKIWFNNFFQRRTYHIFSGSIELGKHNRKKSRIFQRKLLIKAAKGFVAYGNLAKDYLVDLGADEAKVVVMGNTVDTSFFKNRTAELKQKLEKSERKHLTYIGYLNPRKDVQQLFGVLKELLQLRKDVVLDLIGDGESMEELKQMVIANKLEDHVIFHGFKQKEQLPHYLSISSVFLFQTNFDIWGLVLNEAMAAGLPCLASINAGATYDLIEEGETGFKVDFEDHASVAKKIDWMLNNPLKMEQLGERAAHFLSANYNLKMSAKKVTSILLP